MNINANREELSLALQTIQNIIPNRTPLPILSNILIQTEKNNLQLVATDLDIGMLLSIPANIDTKGSITLPARRIGSIIKDLPENDVEITVKKNNVTIVRSGKCVFKLIGIDSEEFPSLPKIEKGTEIKIKTSVIKEMLEMTSFAISKDESRYVLNGLLFIIKNQKLTFVATDGRRLSLRTENIEVNKTCNVKAIVPNKTVLQLERILGDTDEVTINIGENQILFKISNILLISRLIEGEFPDYSQVIPEESKNKVFIKRGEFLNTLRRATILTTTESLGVRLDVSKDDMVVSKNTPDVGELKEKVPIEYVGKQISIGFNPVYLIEALKNIKEEEIAFELTQPEKPGVIRIADKYIYLALPMQLG